MTVGKVAIGIDTPTAADGFEIRSDAPLVGNGGGGMPATCSLEVHASFVVADLGNQTEFFRTEGHLGQCSQFIHLRKDGLGAITDLLDERRHDAPDGGLTEVPSTCKLKGSQAVFPGDRPELVELRVTGFDPSGRAERAVVALAELMPGPDVVVEDPAVVHNPGQHLDVVLGRRRQRQTTRPRFEWIEDDHRPVDQCSEALEAKDHVQSEPIGRPGSDSQLVRQTGIHELLHPFPDAVVGVANGIRVVEEEQVEFAHPAASEGFLGRHAEIVGVIPRAPELRMGEPREAFRAVPFGAVKVVTDGSDQRERIPRQPGERFSQQRIGLAVSVDVGGQERADTLSVRMSGQTDPLGVVQRLTVVHEAATVPGAEGGSRDFHRMTRPTVAGRGIHRQPCNWPCRLDRASAGR